MNDDPRYNSGTSLDRTNKEEQVDYLEDAVGDFSDDLHTGLKKLTIAQLRELRRLVEERIREALENQQVKKG